MADYLNIAGRVRTTASDGVAIEAQEVKDLNRNRSQQDINADVQTELGDRYTKEETYSKEQLNELITTPDVNHVSVVATDATTAVTDVLPDPGEANTIYRVGNWNGTQYDPTMYALFAWNGSAYVCLAVRSFVGEVYDVSVNHPDGQGNPTPYADLAAAIGTNGANIPADIRRGGMSIKFIQGTVQSSGNKYVQYRYMGTAVTGTPNPFIDTTNWQGVDDNPIIGSENLIKSGGVEKAVHDLSDVVGAQQVYEYKDYTGFIIVATNGYPTAAPSGYNSVLIPLKQGLSYRVVNNYTYSAYTLSSEPVLNDSSNVIRRIVNNEDFVAANNEMYILVSLRLSEQSTAFIRRNTSGLAKDIQTNAAGIADNADNIEATNVQVEKLDFKINKNVGIYNDLNVIVDSSMYCGFFYNGTKYAAATSAYNGYFTQVYAGTTIKMNENYGTLNFYFTPNKPLNGATPSSMTNHSAVRTYTFEGDGYIFFNIRQNPLAVIAYSIDAYGLKSDITSLRNEEAKNVRIQQASELSIGSRLVRKNTKNPFSWGSFDKAKLTLRCDDLNNDVDLVAKIVTGEFELPLCLAAPSDKLSQAVSGITVPEEKIGNTKLDICRYVVLNGGEILEHSINTFSSEDYLNENGIKPIFIDQKAKFAEYGIEVRGAAVANTFPSTDLKKALAPYLYYYYDYSDGYGELPPYSNLSNSINDSAVTYQAFCTFLDNAIANNLWVTFIFHSCTGIYGQLTEEILRQILTYITGKVGDDVLEVKTYAEVFDSVV